MVVNSPAGSTTWHRIYEYNVQVLGIPFSAKRIPYTVYRRYILVYLIQHTVEITVHWLLFCTVLGIPYTVPGTWYAVYRIDIPYTVPYVVYRIPYLVIPYTAYYCTGIPHTVCTVHDIPYTVPGA